MRKLILATTLLVIVASCQKKWACECESTATLASEGNPEEEPQVIHNSYKLDIVGSSHKNATKKCDKYKEDQIQAFQQDADTWGNQDMFDQYQIDCNLVTK